MTDVVAGRKAGGVGGFDIEQGRVWGMMVLVGRREGRVAARMGRMAATRNLGNLNWVRKYRYSNHRNMKTWCK